MTESIRNPILTSLPLYDELRSNTAINATRVEGSNVDVLSMEDGEKVAICHLGVILPFTRGDSQPSVAAFEEAAAISLAAHQLNVGDGSIAPQVTDLPKECPIRFTAEFADTEYEGGVALNHVYGMTSRQPGVELLPCAFVGAYRSAVSMPTSIITGFRGFPQVSAGSTSAELDDVSQFPLFARTVPSDHGNAIPIIKYMREVLGITHLAVLNVNDSYGNSFYEGLRLASQEHAPDMIIQQTPLEEDESAIKDAVQSLKDTQFTFFFGIIFTARTHDLIMQEAYRQGIAGTGIHNWLFADSFVNVLGNRKFERESDLHLSYRGVSQIEASGGVPGIAGYDILEYKLSELRNDDDMEYFRTVFPSQFSETAFVDDESFLSSITNAFTPFAYEAAIALGLAACDAINDDLFLNGQAHFDHLVKSRFKSVSGTLTFDPETGTRDPDGVVYIVKNFVPTEVLDPEDGILKVQFKQVITDIFQDSQWQSVQDYMFNDGTTNLPKDLPLHTADEGLNSKLTVGAALTFGVISMAAAFGFAIWTRLHWRSPVVRASHPFFLYLICAGVLVFSAATIPLSIDHQYASLRGCTIACNAVAWLLSLGFSMIFAALFTKTYRISKLLNSAIRFQRIKVTTQDLAAPLIILLSLNIVVLSVMTALSPYQYEVHVVSEDFFGRPSMTQAQCDFNEHLVFPVLLLVINFGALLLTLYQACKARNLITEFAESQHILRCTATVLLVYLVGGPVLLLVSDNPDASLFVASFVIFATCCSVLLFIFVPKVQYVNQNYSGEHVRGSEFEEGMKVLTTKSAQELALEVEKLKLLLDANQMTDQSFDQSSGFGADVVEESKEPSQPLDSQVHVQFTFESDRNGGHGAILEECEQRPEQMNYEFQSPENESRKTREMSIVTWTGELQDDDGSNRSVSHCSTNNND